jgi:hypothetical protein
LVVYESFGARIGPWDADAYVGNGDNDGTPLRRFPIRCGPAPTLVKGGPAFDGYEGIRFPGDPAGEQEFCNILRSAACWLADWQVENGWSHSSDWRGWPDDEARAYAVGLFEWVQDASGLAAAKVPQRANAAAI